MDPVLLQRWKDNLVFINFGERELFEFTQEDFDNKARFYKDLGVTHALFSSAFHCRISLHPYWDVILSAMGKFIKSCRKYGVKTVEHFSVVVPHKIGDKLKVDTFLDTYDKRLPGLRELITDDNGTIEGHRVSSFYQIDGSTGEPYISELYRTAALCLNNPVYKKILFKHLEDIYDLGVEGIMTDDVEKYNINACACVHCRALFKESYGCDLPETKDWHTFAGDYNNPMYIDWLRFRHETAKNFQYYVNEHFTAYGMKDMARPNYVFSCLNTNYTSYPFEAAAPLWTHTFAENCYGHKTGHLAFACEAVHRTAMGERTGAASMAMFYPQNEHETYFSYANAWCWGQAYLGSGTEETAERTRPLREYENAHWDSLFAVKKNSDFAVYFSTDTRDYAKDSDALYQRPLIAWMQAAYLSVLNMDMVFQYDSAETLSRHKYILASHIAMLTDEQLENLIKYVKNGGKLITAGPFGIFDGAGKPRDAYKAFGLDIKIEEIKPLRKDVIINGNTIKNASIESYVSSGGEAFLTGGDGKVLAVKHVCGAGELIVAPSSLVGEWYQEAVLFYWLDPDWLGGPPMADAPAYRVDDLRNSVGVFLKETLDEPAVEIKTDNPDILGFSHASRDGDILAVKLINIADTFVKEKRRYNNFEDIKHFHLTTSAKLPHTVEVSVPETNGFAAGEAVLSTPERPGVTQTIPVTGRNGRLHFTVPENYFAGFALVELKK